MRQLLRSCLADLNAEFVECSDGWEAVTVCAEHPPDWVVMDLKMPRMDGLTAARQIRAAHADVRIVIITQFEGRLLRQAAIEAGACGYILKDDLHTVQEFLLGMPPIPGPNQPPPENLSAD